MFQGAKELDMFRSNYGHFAYCLVISPTVWSFLLLDTSPTSVRTILVSGIEYRTILEVSASVDTPTILSL